MKFYKLGKNPKTRKYKQCGKENNSIEVELSSDNFDLLYDITIGG